MAYYNIEKRLKSDGTPRYRCNVIIKEKGVITYSCLLYTSGLKLLMVFVVVCILKNTMGRFIHF